MKDKEAKAKLAEMSLVLRKNAMLKVGATKDNLRKPAVDSLEKHEPNPSTKPHNVMNPRFYERYKARLMAAFSDNLENIFDLFYDNNVIGKYIIEDPDSFKNRRDDVMDVMMELINDLILETPSGLIRRQLPQKNRRCAYLCGTTDQYVLRKEALWSSIFYVLNQDDVSPYDIDLIFNQVIQYINGIYQGFLFPNPDPDTDKPIDQMVYYEESYHRISILTELAILLTGGDPEIVEYMKQRREDNKNSGLDVVSASLYFNRAESKWVNPIFNAWINACPDVKLSQDTELLSYNNDVQRFIWAVAFTTYILNSTIVDWTASTVMGITL